MLEGGPRPQFRELLDADNDSGKGVCRVDLPWLGMNARYDQRAAVASGRLRPISRRKRCLSPRCV